MRGRYLMREYWSDSDLFLRLSADEREVYIGLWMLADDDGWLPRDVPGIAGALLRYMDRGPREAKVRLALRRLGSLGKVSSLRCGCLYLPAVSKYPRAGKKSSENRLFHVQTHEDIKRIRTDLRSSATKAKPIQTDLNPSPVPSLPVPSLPDVARADDAAEPSSGAFGESMAAAGIQSAIAGKPS
jgi:hypothetical protein